MQSNTTDLSVNDCPLFEKINLTADQSSWVHITTLPSCMVLSDKQMDKLWNLHPSTKGSIKIMNKEIETPRWHQAYGLPYRFSGVNHRSKPMPSIIKRYMDYCNLCLAPYLTDFQNHSFNMCLVNWYENGLHYIGYHSDDENPMLLNAKGESLVVSISFGQTRTFVLREKTNKTNKVKLNMPHGTLIIMGGKCQKTHQHTVPKVTGVKGQNYCRRINLTFRIFKTATA